jgi:excisionase family DNA binding protein
MAALLSVDEAAAYLGISKYQVRQAYRAKRLPHRVIGRLVKFTQADLDVFVERALVRPKTAPAPTGRRQL